MSGVISSITDLYSATSTGKITNESVNSASEIDEEENASAGTYSKYDTLDLSRDYLNYKTQSESSTISDETNLLNSTTGELLPSLLSDKDSTSLDLSSYSETELMDMVRDGTITSAEYMKEMATRNSESDTSAATDELPPPSSPEMTSEKPNIGVGNSSETNSGE